MKINVIEEVPVKIRDAMVPSPGYVWVSCDYSQLEYRMMTNLAEDEHLVKMFEDGVDFHTATASMMFNVPPDKVDKKLRKQGKCVTGDTLIYSPSHGLIRIDEVSDFREEDQFIPLEGFDVINMDGEICKADSFYYGGVRKVTNIITRYGFKLGGSTDKHRIIVLDENGFPVYKKMADLTLDDKVVIYLGGFEKETDDYIKFSDCSALKDRERYSTHRNDYPCSFVLEDVTEDVAELWGMLLSDGLFHTSGDYVSFGSADHENIDRFVYLAKQLYPGYEPYVKYCPTKRGVAFWNVFINSYYVTEQFSHGKFGRKGFDLQFPQEILQSKTSVKAAFLKGWFNGDGCFTKKVISTVSISKAFIVGMQHCLLSMGILSCVTSETPTTMKGTDYLAWKLYLVDTISLHKFYDFVYSGLIQRKKYKFDEFMERHDSHPQNLQITYNLKECVKQAMPGLTFEQRKGKYRYLNKGINSFGYACIKELYISESISDENKALLQRFLDREIIAVPIKDIYETEEEVFDLHVPQGHQFVAGSFIGHNSLNFGISFGMTVNGLARTLGCSKQEAQEKQNLYFKNIPKIRDLINKTKATTKARGYSRTFLGRMRPFKKQLENAAGNWYKEDNALMTSFNSTVQGSAADFAKIALARCYQAIKPYGDKIRMLTQVHDEINFEVKCVNDDGTIDSAFLAEALKVIDYAMSYRGIYPGWADIPADIEIGWNYGSLMGSEEIKKEFGVDVLAIQASQPPTDLPKFLFENLNYDVINKTDLKAAEKSLGLNKKGSASKGSDGSKSGDKLSGDKNTAETDQGPSKGQEMAHRLEQKMRSGGKIDGRLDLSNASFRTSTVLIYLKDGVNDSLAFDKLKDHVKNNFGTYDIVLEHQGILYRFHSDLE